MEGSPANDHIVFVGTSEKNSGLPPNKEESSFFPYIKLLGKVIWQQLNNFYSVYFLILGILQALPDLTSTQPWGTFVPVVLYLIINYIFELLDLKRLQQASKVMDAQTFLVYRDHKSMRLKSTKIQAGDIYAIIDQTPVPCDSILCYSTNSNIYIDTSYLDGESELRDKFSMQFPPLFTLDKLMDTNCVISATNPSSGTRNVSGLLEVDLLSPLQEDDKSESQDISSHEIPHSPSESDIIQVPFNSDNFVERGSIVRSTGTHFFIALYTGRDCRSSTALVKYTPKVSVVEGYLEKLSVIAFFVQFIIAIVIGTIGAVLNNGEDLYYTQEIDTPIWGQIIIIITRDYLLLSYMIPINLKIILPIFRLVYGVYISSDSYFRDDIAQTSAKSFSTTITENLGSLDLIIADKTGTLTENKLRLISVSCIDKQYGCNQYSTILEDEQLKDELKSSNIMDFVMFWKALSICHSIRFSEDNVPFGSSADELAIVEALISLGFSFHQAVPNELQISSPLGSYKFKILRIIPFNRKKMKMSIVVQDNRGIYCFTKGAPEMVIRQCSSHSGSSAGLYDQYQQKGLRTLSISFKEVTDYTPDMAEESLEEMHRLLGTLAIEDALQNDARLSIEVLQQTDLKIWVATGDAAKNTIVNAAQLGLIKSSDKIVHITTNILRNKVAEFASASYMTPASSFAVLVDCEEDEDVQEALEKPELVSALLRARCVIFYRCKPATKARVAISVRVTGKKVLAVGDGANDTQLLSAADVGVGIFGENRSHRFDSCDYAISSFRHLNRLILVHGHAALHRSMLAIHFSYYKGALFAFCQAIYQFWTSFSGQSFFGSFSLLSYNIFWTSIPMCAILFDKDISDNFLFQLSFLYKQLQNPLAIRFENLSWLFIALYQSIASMVIAWALTGEAFLEDAEGKDLGKDFLADCVYFALVLVVIFYLMYQLNTFTYYSIVAIFGTILMMVASSAALQSGVNADSLSESTIFDIRDWTGFYGECFSTWSALLLVITIFLADVIPPWVGLTIWNGRHATETLLAIEKETLAAKEDEPLFFTSRKQYKETED